MTDCNEKPDPKGTPTKTIHKLPFLLELDLIIYTALLNISSTLLFLEITSN
jgi:hypothetical protein